MNEEHAPRRRVAIVGASGFVGARLVEALAETDHVVAIARSVRKNAENVEWRAADLYSLQSTRASLAGCEVAYYLVHSMMPSSRLMQGRFHDTDLLLADNFARACVDAGVKRIVYLGGLVPEHGFVSEHLESRREVELVLTSSGIPTTCLRAGLVVGKGGSSFEMLRQLVERLPWMILPHWTQSRTQAVFIDDVVRVLSRAAHDSAFEGRTFDLVNGESLTYEALLRKTVKALGKQTVMVRVPLRSTAFSKRWVQLFSGAAFELVSPLIDSLQCDLPASAPAPEIAALIEYTSFESMIGELLGATETRVLSAPRRTELATVRSVQRLPAITHADARFVADEYMRWLPKIFAPLIFVQEDAASSRKLAFRLIALSKPLLLLERIDDGVSDRVKFHIVGGLLTKTTATGWLEFRQIANRRFLLAAIHEFVPALPWLIYRMTQAPIHAWVMRRFGAHLSRSPGR